MKSVHVTLLSIGDAEGTSSARAVLTKIVQALDDGRVWEIDHEQEADDRCVATTTMGDRYCEISLETLSEKQPDHYCLIVITDPIRPIEMRKPLLLGIIIGGISVAVVLTDLVLYKTGSIALALLTFFIFAPTIPGAILKYFEWRERKHPLEGQLLGSLIPLLVPTNGVQVCEGNPVPAN